MLFDLRNDLGKYGGSNDISLIWGDEKKGLLHIAQRHGAETVGKAIDALIDGKITKYIEGNKTLHIEKDGYKAILSLDESGNKKSWLLTGFEINEKAADENGKVSAKSVPTQAAPILSRRDVGATAAENIGKNKYEIKNNSQAFLDFVEKQACLAADEAVVRAFGEGSALNQSNLQRGGEVQKMLTMFYTFGGAMFNRFYYSAKRAGQQWTMAQGVNQKALAAWTLARANWYLFVLAPLLF